MNHTCKFFYIEAYTLECIAVKVESGLASFVGVYTRRFIIGFHAMTCHDISLRQTPVQSKPPIRFPGNRALPESSP